MNQATTQRNETILQEYYRIKETENINDNLIFQRLSEKVWPCGKGVTVIGEASISKLIYAARKTEALNNISKKFKIALDI